MTEQIYEMLWDCEYCSTKKLLGKTHRFCPKCGAPQNANKRYFPSESEKIAVKNHVYVGVDKICPACNTAQAANVAFCTNCSASMDGSKQVNLVSATNEPKDSHNRFQSKKSFDSRRQTIREKYYKNIKKQEAIESFDYVKLGKALLFFLIIGFILLTIFWTKDVVVYAMGHSWSRRILIEDYRARNDSSWCDSIPSDAYSISKSKKVRSYKQVPDGETCSTQNVDLGDGTFKQEKVCETNYRDEPVYDEHCSYTVDRWRYARDVIAGASDKSPYWPTYTLACTDTTYGCEREGSRESQYNLHLREPKEKINYQCHLDEGVWQNSKIESRWNLKVGVITGGERCGSLKPVD